MNDYKSDFEELHGVKWEYSSQKLFDCYYTYVDKKIKYNTNPRATKISKKKKKK